MMVNANTKIQPVCIFQNDVCFGFDGMIIPYLRHGNAHTIELFYQYVVPDVTY
jgi:hypothetical protein